MLSFRLPRSRRRPSHRSRRAVATVEFAICLPALIALTIGTIDICSMLFLKESITLAAYEGARRGVGRDRTNADVISRVQEFLDERNIAYDGNPCTFGTCNLEAGCGSAPVVCEEEDPRRAGMVRFNADGSGEELIATGLRNAVGFDQWMELDLEYIDGWSLGLDLKIMAKTVKEVLRGGGS